jgi:hypothetical protein
MPENTTEPSNNIIANSYETQVIKTFRILPQTKPVEIVRGTQQARVYLDDSSDDITVSVWVVAAVGGACALLVVTVFVIFCCKLRKRRNDLENGSKDELDGEYEVQLAPGAYNSLPCKPTSANASSVQTTENNFPKPNSTLNNPIEFESAYDTLTAQGRRGNDKSDVLEMTSPFNPFEFDGQYDTLTSNNTAYDTLTMKDSSNKGFFPLNKSATEKKNAENKEEPCYSIPSTDIDN